MIKKILIGVAVLFIGLVIIPFAYALYFAEDDEIIVLNFLKENPDKSTIKLVRNDTLITERSPDKMMPLASTAKIIIAIEYAEQSAKGLINPDQEIPLNELEKFHVPNTDGGAHPRWKKSIRDKTTGDKISIRELAKGMIRYSSNANTEWLSAKLGLENINNRIDSLGIVKHTDMYYFVSSLFVGKEKFPNEEGEGLEKKLKELSLEEYIKATNQIHDKLLTDTIYKKDKGDLRMSIQRIWSDNLPNSTVAEYVGLMKKINSRTYFNPETQKYLDEVMEFLLDNPKNRKWLEHTGMKGGSTAFVLTKALYATDKKGNKTELAYFLNDLNKREKRKLGKRMNEFELKILTNEAFRGKVKKALQN